MIKRIFTEKWSKKKHDRFITFHLIKSRDLTEDDIFSYKQEIKMEQQRTHSLYIYIYITSMCTLWQEQYNSYFCGESKQNHAWCHGMFLGNILIYTIYITIEYTLRIIDTSSE